MKPKVTVVVPTINRGSLTDTLHSLELQTYKDFEVILVDDSAEQLVESSKHKVLRTGGLVGVSNARNLAMTEACTEFIALLDDDDKWHREHLERQITNFENLSIDFSASSALVNNHRRPSNLLQIGADPFELLYGKPHLLRSKAYLPTSSYMFRAEIAKSIKFDTSIKDRENLKFVREIFQASYKMYQDPVSSVVINYSARNSLSRIDLAQEVEWARYLGSLNSTWSDNFIIESSRNFIRNGEKRNAKLIMEMIHPKEKFLHKTILKILAL